MADFREAGRPVVDESEALHNSQDACREFIGENLEMAGFQADIGAQYASVGDDFGLTYALRRAVAHIKAAIGAHADLQASKSQEPRP